jgi:hypothetical protein
MQTHAPSYIPAILRLLEPLSHRLPVDHVPDGIEVLGLAVLVLEVVRVLPGVDAEQRSVGAADGVLVRARDDAEGAALLVLDQPRPAAALNACQRRVQLLAEGVEGAEVAVDRALLRWGIVSKGTLSS